MFTLALHLQADDLEWLAPIAKHLGHIEVAIDYTDPQPAPPPVRRVHPAVEAVIDADVDERKQAKLRREADRKTRERMVQAKLSPRVIQAVPCPKESCLARIGQPCHGPGGQDFGMTGHTHLARREAFADIQKAGQ